MIAYILKSALCALFFLLFYRFLIEKEKMLRFKRFFLLGALVFSLLIPFADIPPLLYSIPSVEEISSNIYDFTTANVEAEFVDSQPQRQVVVRAFPWISVVAGLYFFVVSILLVRFVRNLFGILKLGKSGQMIRRGKVRIVLEDRLNISFSFFNYVFISKNDYENSNIRNKILIHELIHIKQMHSADVMFVELLIAFFWFNPVLYLYRRAIKLNHEFLADEGVINSTGDVYTYQRLLVERAASPCACSLISNFNYRITKKRLIMMTKTTSRRSFLFKMALLVPAFLIAGGVFSGRMVARINPYIPIDKMMVQQGLSVAGDNLIRPESGISQEQMDQYANIVSKYLDEAQDGKVTWKSMEISDSDELVLYPLYIQMSQEQRKKQLISYKSVYTPIKLRSPNVDEWRACQNRDEIWLDWKQIDKETAKTLNRKDIVYFIYSRKPGKAFIWTKKGYDDFMNQYGKQILLSDLLKMPPVAGFMMGYKTKSRVVKGGRFEE